MFTSLEGMARDNAKMINENGDLHVTRILNGSGLLVWGVHDLPVAQRGPVWPAAETNGISPHLLQLHGTDNGHPKRAPRQLLQAGGVGKNVQRLLLCGALAQELPYGGSLEGPAPHHPFGSIEGAVGAGGERCPDMYMVPTIHLCQIDTPTEAGRALPPTAAH